MAKAAVAETHEVSADAKAWLDWFETAGVLPEATQAHRDHEAGGADRPGASSHDADKSGIPPSYDRAAEGADGEMGAVGSDADPEVPLARPMELLADAGTPPGAKKVGKGEHNGSAPGGKSKGSGQDAAIRSLMTRLNDKADTYLLTWVTAASQAAQELPGQIPDKTGAYNFGMALAGNLAWASTSLFPEAQVAVAVISFGGSIVGSGTLSKSNPAFPTADINDSLDKGRDVAKNAFKKACPKLAAQIMKKCGPDDADGQNKALWEYLFSGKKVAFDDMSGLLGAARAELKRFSDQVLPFLMQNASGPSWGSEETVVLVDIWFERQKKKMLAKVINVFKNDHYNPSNRFVFDSWISRDMVDNVRKVTKARVMKAEDVEGCPQPP